jgi:hypothetical protein
MMANRPTSRRRFAQPDVITGTLPVRLGSGAGEKSFQSLVAGPWWIDRPEKFAIRSPSIWGGTPNNGGVDRRTIAFATALATITGKLAQEKAPAVGFASPL